MIRSMTAYGRASVSGEDKDITVELRSVNSRYFDCTVKIPRMYAFLEDRIRSYLQQHATTRGKVEVTVTYTRHTAGVRGVSADIGYARAYVETLRRVQTELGLPDEPTLAQLVVLPDLFTVEREEEDPAGEWERLYVPLSEAAAQFLAMREREGARTLADITGILGQVRDAAKQVEQLALAHKDAYRERLEARLRAVLAEHQLHPDEGRVLTECAVFADRIAVDEELARLESHFAAFDEIAGQPDPSGKKLDFLLQEMNRETNTVGSKCAHAGIARLVVEMKNGLEKVREQVQNIE